MSDPITLTTFFGISKAGGDIFIKISKALGLIESIESKLDCLMQVEFNAAWKTLIQACNSSALEQQRDILIIGLWTKKKCSRKISANRKSRHHKLPQLFFQLSPTELNA
jgi:hypothetical protein